MVLLLEDHPGRKKLKEYFYSDRPWLTLMFWTGIATLGLIVGFFILAAWAILKVYFMLAGSKGDERLYDEILAQDVEVAIFVDSQVFVPTNVFLKQILASMNFTVYKSTINATLFHSSTFNVEYVFCDRVSCFFHKH